MSGHNEHNEHSEHNVDNEHNEHSGDRGDELGRNEFGSDEFGSDQGDQTDLGGQTDHSDDARPSQTDSDGGNSDGHTVVILASIAGLAIAVIIIIGKPNQYPKHARLTIS